MTRQCEYCDKEFVPNRKDKRYCKRTCKQKASLVRNYGATGAKVNFRKACRNKLDFTKCSFCGFVPIHKCQLDIDHIDGDRNNNHIDNFQILCANCHRLKTHINKDTENRYKEKG